MVTKAFCKQGTHSYRKEAEGLSGGGGGKEATDLTNESTEFRRRQAIIDTLEDGNGQDNITEDAAQIISQLNGD